MKQLIIARKDLQMSPGKLAAQVSHASMAFLTNNLRANGKKILDCQCISVWDDTLIDKNHLSEQVKKMEQRNARRQALGSNYLEGLIVTHDGTYIRKPRLYRRNDLSQWVEEARGKGENLVYFRPVDSQNQYGELELCEPTYHMESKISIDIDTWNDWICGSFTKVVCEAKNKYQLEKVCSAAASLGLEQDKDYFLIKDNCLTELEPEEYDGKGQGRTLTCIGFRPLEDNIVHQLSKKYQLYK